MRISDKLLTAVILGLVTVAVIALIAQSRQSSATGYLEGTTPEDVTSNYILAIQNEEYERAYGYLSPQLLGYPDDLQEFSRQVNTDHYRFDQDEVTDYQVISVTSREDWATVKVEESHFSHYGLLFNNRWSLTFTIHLELIDGDWKISGGDRFLAYCWTRSYCP